MTIKFLKEHGRFSKGQILPDVFRADALQLIADGIAEELGKPTKPAPAPVEKPADGDKKKK